MAVYGDLCHRFSRKSIHFVRFRNPRLIRNQQVDGSNPPASSRERKHDKTVVFSAFLGVGHLPLLSKLSKNQAKPLIFYLLLDSFKSVRHLKSPRIRDRFKVSFFSREVVWRLGA